ncbi:hypothetical protein HDE_11183 [Halotydeus destructor]|nr:hypothetical protein HDE_11183 [Halotydeus destructor]
MESRFPFRFFYAYMCLTAMFCCWQLFHVLSEYCLYDTVTRVTINRPFKTRPPLLIMCLKLDAFIPGYDSKGLHVKQLFDSTPEAEGLIEQCIVRLENSYDQSDLLSSEECSKMFEIRKYVKQRYVCYSFNVQSNMSDFKVHHVTNGLHAPRFYKIRLNASFTGGSYFYFYVHSNKLGVYGRSQSFTEQFRDVNQTGYGQHNYVTLTYKIFHSHKLPFPYKTKCRDFAKDERFESGSQCFEDCIKKKISSILGKLPFSIALYDKPEMQLIAENDLKNETIRRTLDIAETKCGVACPANCHSTDYTPLIISSAGQQKPFLDLYITNEPDITAHFIAKQSLIDITVYVLSCIGFWFGFSPLAAMMDVEQLVRSKINKKKIHAASFELLNKNIEK